MNLDPAADARKIANGHAWHQHQEEFPTIETIEEFARLIERVISQPSASRKLSRGRWAFWDDDSETLVIHDENSADSGTAFRPARGKAYFENLR